MTTEFREAQRTNDAALTDAVGRASEALEYVERARGRLYSMHQLIGRADLLFEEAAALLRSAGQPEAADRLDREVVGRNVLDGRWTFQVVDEFDELYHGFVTAGVRRLELEYHDGERHVYEAQMKEERRSSSQPGHEYRPAVAHNPAVETD